MLSAAEELSEAEDDSLSEEADEEDSDELAVLPFAAGVILVAISVVLTMIAGLIPSKLAAKKDPVIALRSE